MGSGIWVVINRVKVKKGAAQITRIRGGIQIPSFRLDPDEPWLTDPPFVDWARHYPFIRLSTMRQVSDVREGKKDPLCIKTVAHRPSFWIKKGDLGLARVARLSRLKRLERGALW